MTKISLSRLCKQDEDHELVKVRCKHGHFLPLMTSWTSRNLDRHYWTCPYYGDDSTDERSKFVISKLLGRIGELEERVESSANCAFCEHKIADDKTTRITKSVESKIDMNKIELQMDNFQDDLKMMKANEKKWKIKLAKSKKREKQLWTTLICVCILGVSFLFQFMFLEGAPRRLP
ncbi:putative glutamyl-tRNA(Gln) amidotransferase subunit A, mitochondrial-like [Capsicum annuum]|nr:putative glutamyl-tRNA(Gln) amidotransferase subunit A, mitochondrial-like [Capsicum annuum]